MRLLKERAEMLFA
jgi:hypothetical protein